MWVIHVFSKYLSSIAFNLAHFSNFISVPNNLAGESVATTS